MIFSFLFMNKQIHFKYWNETDVGALSSAKTFKDLSIIALNILERFPVGVHMVSGPISTGGVGTLEGNRKVFERVVELLATEQSLNIFSQMPFEDKMVELYRKWHIDNPTEKYCMPILTDFYQPVFSSGKVSNLHFIYGWESSFGAKWEHNNCDEWSIKRNYLPQELSLRALNNRNI